MKQLILFTTLLIGFIITNPNLQAQNGTVFTIKKTVDARSGPGVYYDLVVRLFEGATITLTDEKESIWQKVKIDTTSGWIPYFLLNTPPTANINNQGKDKIDIERRMDSMFNEMSGGVSKDDLKASPARVAAAVKGFAKKYRTSKGVKTRIDLSESHFGRINWREYKSFIRDRIHPADWRDKMERFQLKTNDTPPYDPEMDQSGYAIASVIAENGLYLNYELQRYLNYMANFIVESSHRPDIPVQIHILDSNEILGYAVPGGYIFISRGALRLMETEAELAHFLGHEIAHLTFGHGMEEYRVRKPRIRMNEMIGELDSQFELSDTDLELNSMADELTAWTDEVFDFVSKERLEKYEIEADYWGMAYAYRAGYDPKESINYLSRMRATNDGLKYLGSMEWQGTPLMKRIQSLDASMRKLRIRGGDSHRSEFQKMKRLVH